MLSPPPEPRVLVIAGDGPISEISDISGFLLPTKWRPELGPPAVGDAFLLYLFLVFIRIAGVNRERRSPSGRQWKTTDITDFTDHNRPLAALCRRLAALGLKLGACAYRKALPIFAAFCRASACSASICSDFRSHSVLGAAAANCCAALTRSGTVSDFLA
jgi:hypothetical protein